MNSWTDTRSIIIFVMCFYVIQTQTVLPRTGHKLNELTGKLFDIKICISK